jgi:hypothetical protein
MNTAYEASDGYWHIKDEQGRLIGARFLREADARAFVALPALEDLLKDYRQEHSLDGCQRFEQESIGDNSVIDVVDRRCGYCCLADKLLAALAQADGSTEK